MIAQLETLFNTVRNRIAQSSIALRIATPLCYLENVCLQGSLSLQKLWSCIQPAVKQMEIMSLIVNSINSVSKLTLNSVMYFMLFLFIPSYVFFPI